MEVIMPKMGESINEGTIIKWHKKVGEEVKRDEIIFEISTDKVDTEIPSPGDGVLTDIKYKEGDTVEVGTVVATIDSNGEASAPVQKEEKKEAPKEEKKETPKAEKKEEVKEVKKETPSETPAKEQRAAKTASSGKTVDVSMPKMGESVMEGTILKWHKKTGDKIEKDEILFEISTDKVDTEVPSSEAGVVAEILVAEQETVEVGTVVARIAPEGTEVSAQAEPKAKAVREEKVEEQSEQMHDVFAKHAAEEREEPKGDSDKFYSPLVMSIAQKEGVSYNELESIKGTGQGGRVTKKDILGYLEDRKSGKAAPKKEEHPEPSSKAQTTTKPAYQTPQTSSSSADVERIEMDNIRQKIMQHMIRSRDTSVHVAAMLEVDMSKIHNFIKAKKEEYQQKEGVKLTYMAFVAHAAVRALKEYPLVNSTIDGTTILKKKFINLGIAVAIEPTGLIVPNIKSAGDKNIIGLAKSISDAAYRARNRKLTPDDISNGTFTITNYGVFGTIFGTPIINQPEVAILGVGAVEKKPVVVEVEGMDTIAIKPIMALTLAHDHRLIDGMLGGMFLKYIKDTLESFDASMI